MVPLVWCSMARSTTSSRCEKNWKNWDTGFARDQIPKLLRMLTRSGGRTVCDDCRECLLSQFTTGEGEKEFRIANCGLRNTKRRATSKAQRPTCAVRVKELSFWRAIGSA